MERTPSAIQIMNEVTVSRSLARITHEIIEHNNGVKDVVLIGIKRRGIPLAHILADNILKFEGERVEVGYLDITKFRDDISQDIKDGIAASDAIHLNTDIAGKVVILVDDVLFTGRTIRAALEAIFAFGRARCVQLAVLVDRGHREIPIHADYVGKNIPTSLEEHVVVHIAGIDEETSVAICKG